MLLSLFERAIQLFGKKEAYKVKHLSSHNFLSPRHEPMSNRINFERINNTGIAFMRNGMFEQAISHFRFALGELANGLEAQSQENVGCFPSNNDLRSRVTLQSSEDIRMALSHGLKNKDNDACFPDHNTLVLHSSAFYCLGIARENSGTNPVPFDDPCLKCESCLTTVLSGILLFNMALCFHLRALVIVPGNDRRSQQEDLAGARQIYWNAKRVFDRTPPSVYQQLSWNEQRVFVAIHNNMAHTCFHFFDVQETQRHLAMLRSLLSLHYRHREDRLVQDPGHKVDERDGHFLWNAMMCKIAESSPSA